MGSVRQNDIKVLIERCILLQKENNQQLTIFRKGELENRGDKERQRTFGVVDLSAALTQPPRLSLVSDLIQAAILSCHKNTP